MSARMGKGFLQSFGIVFVLLVGVYADMTPWTRSGVYGSDRQTNSFPPYRAVDSGFRRNDRQTRFSCRQRSRGFTPGQRPGSPITEVLPFRRG
jgi:hypothetical protein